MNKESFDALLNWLNPERELAAQKYEQIRNGLIKVFIWNGYDDGESLADDVISRVAAHATELLKTYVGDPARYFHGVARKVLLEGARRPRSAELNPNLEAANDFVNAEENAIKERRHFCLEKCLQEQDDANRDLILSYYHENKAVKTAFRKSLAAEHGIDTNALRVRVYRIRQMLRQCIDSCVRELEARETN